MEEITIYTPQEPIVTPEQHDVILLRAYRNREFNSLNHLNNSTEFFNVLQNLKSSSSEMVYEEIRICVQCLELSERAFDKTYRKTLAYISHLGLPNFTVEGLKKI